MTRHMHGIPSNRPQFFFRCFRLDGIRKFAYFRLDRNLDRQIVLSFCEKGENLFFALAFFRDETTLFCYNFQKITLLQHKKTLFSGKRLFPIRRNTFCLLFPISRCLATVSY